MKTLQFLGNGRRRGLMVCGLLAFATAANADWTVVRLNPPGSGGSQALGVGGVQQVGYTQINTASSASLWTGSAQSYVDLDPFGDGNVSSAYDTDGAFQVGYVSHPTYGGKAHAALWQGTAASYLDLNPAGATESYAFGVDGGSQAGRARFGGVTHAGIWAGSAGSWVDLHPSVGLSSTALGIGDGQQVGRVLTTERVVASLWSGSAQSWVNLNPAGASTSTALATTEGRQVGVAEIGGVGHAGYWTGSAASWVSLNQPGWTFGTATGAFENLTVGSGDVGGQSHAGLWSGSAESWVDLHSLLPSLFISSQATAVWRGNGRTYVVGYGNNNDNGEALLWVSDVVPECDGVVVMGLGLGLLFLPILRARK